MKNNRDYYVNRSVEARTKAFMLRFMLIIAICFTSVAVYGAVTDPDNAIENICASAGTGSMAMAGMITIKDVSDRETTGNAISVEVYLLPVDEINRKTFPKIGANREVGDIQMNPNKYMHYAEAHTYPTFIANYSKENGAITVTATNTFSLTLGGFRDDVLNLVEDRIGAKFVILFKICSTGKVYGMGSICQPVTLSTAEVKADGDSRSAALTFTQQAVELPWTYVGNIVEQDPVTVAANATSVPLVSENGQYLITNGTAAAASISAVTGLTAADVGRTISFIGDGSTFPSQVADGLPFILVNGATWTASKGSILTLRVFDVNTLIELSRS